MFDGLIRSSPTCALRAWAIACGDLRARQVAALARLGALADLDLHPLRRVDQQRRDAEAAAGDLLAAVLRVAPVHVGDLAALAVHAEHVGAEGGLGVGAERGLALAAEAHRADEERQRVLAHLGAHLVGRDAVLRRGELRLHGVAQGHGLLVLEPVERLGVLLVAALGRGDPGEGLPHLRVHARQLDLGRALLAGADLAALLGEVVEGAEPEAPAVRGAEARDGEDVEHLGGDPDGRHQASVAAQLVDAERRQDLLHALLQALEHVRGGGRRLGGAVHGLLHHRVGAERLGAEAERDHHVVDVADARRLQHQAGVAAPATTRPSLAGLAQGLVDRGDGEVGVADALVGAGAPRSCEDDQLGARLTAATAASARWARCAALAAPRSAAAGAPTRQSQAARTSSMQATPVPMATRRSSGRRSARRAAAHPADQDRHAQLAALRRLRLDPLDRGPPAEHDAVEKCSTSRSRSMAGLVTTATVSCR